MSSATPTAEQIAYMEAHASATRVPNLIVCGAITLVLGYLAVSFRFISHRLGAVPLGADDIMILIGLAFFTAFTAATLTTTKYGMGRHIIMVTDAKDLTITVTVSEALYSMSIMWIKLSILMLYRRIFPSKQFHMLVWGMVALISAYSFTAMLLSIMQCLPIASRWDTSISGTCVNYYGVVVWSGVMNIITDFALLGMPIPMISRLRMSRHKKIMLILVFGTGAGACGVSIARCIEARNLRAADSTWADMGALYASLLEISVGICSACVPTYKPLWSRIFHSHGGMTSFQKPTLPASSFHQGGNDFLHSRNTSKGWSELTTNDSRAGSDAMPINAIQLDREYHVDLNQV